MPKRERVTSLEKALLANREQRSPVLEVEFAPGVEARVQFRRLTQTQEDRLDLDARTWVEDERRRREKDGREWREHEGSVDKVHKNRWDLLCLHAAMEDPDHPDTPPCRLQDLENELDCDVHHYLAEKWEQWKAGLNPDVVTDEDIDAFREAVKKNMDPPSLWRHFGFQTVFASAISSVREALETSPEPSSSPTPS